ncbi:MAG: phosphotyrosine protein phosphatase [Gammaproteobacteria bacterium]
MNARYGTYRGWIRLQLANIERMVGRLKRFEHVDLLRVERFVFVCLGNVCRSPYGEFLAREAGLNSASLGLSTSTGIPAFPKAIEIAGAFGHNLTSHSATDLSDFAVRGSDLFLVMEVRQARFLQKKLNGTGAQVALLGLWAEPARPHIHDPMSLSDEYFKTCYRVIQSAVIGLKVDLETGAARQHN